jgi:hypothetical protein
MKMRDFLLGFLRNMLLPRLLSGEIRVAEDNCNGK